MGEESKDEKLKNLWTAVGKNCLLTEFRKERRLGLPPSFWLKE
jgi:hypothetical protein